MHPLLRVTGVLVTFAVVVLCGLLPFTISGWQLWFAFGVLALQVTCIASCFWFLTVRG